jgi:hypothetical protein
VAAWQADIVGTELYAQADVTIAKDLVCNAVQRVAIGMWLELRAAVSNRRDYVNEVVRFDSDHVFSLEAERMWSVAS